MTYDNNGNILTASGKTYTYNAANRMATSNDGTNTTSYLINFMGQRTKKSNSTDFTWFIYDENDNVIAEYDAAGNLKDEYVYLDNRPVALIRSSNLYYIYTDHLNTPRAITDTSNNLQWTWENKEAFGNNLPTEVVTGFKFNFRLPGQYFDSETNLNYNIHRDYNPVWGRYMSSDPLGLAAGVNTYGYVSGNSLRSSDRLGLNSFGFNINDKNNLISNPRAIIDDSEINPYIFGKGFLSYKAFYAPVNIYTQKDNVAIELSFLYKTEGRISYLRSPSSNCHGLTFTGGAGWLENAQVPTVLNYIYTAIQTPSTIGDIAVFIQNDNNAHIHSSRLVEGNMWLSKDKDGNEQTGALKYKWPKPYTIKYYRLKK